MRANYKARVVFDIDRDSYIVEYKRYFWSSWKFDRSYGINSYSPKSEAERSAIECCNALCNQRVVYISKGLK